MQRISIFCKGFTSLSNVFRPARIIGNHIHVTPGLAQSGDGEERIESLLKSKLEVDEIMVRDISGGCGSMYEIYVVAKDFKDKKTIQQHRIVNEILKDEVKQMHGLRIHTKVPG